MAGPFSKNARRPTPELTRWASVWAAVVGRGSFVAGSRVLTSRRKRGPRSTTCLGHMRTGGSAKAWSNYATSAATGQGRRRGRKPGTVPVFPAGSGDKAVSNPGAGAAQVPLDLYFRVE